MLVVFGCAGLRDHSKRPLMGKIAVKYADKVIITAEDPRTETLDSIYSDITSSTTPLPPPKLGGGGRQAGGGTREDKVLRIDDRQQAIQKAVSLAKKGDIVVITGKGHEKSMCFGKTEYPWSDREALEKVIHLSLGPSPKLRRGEPKAGRGISVKMIK